MNMYQCKEDVWEDPENNILTAYLAFKKGNIYFFEESPNGTWSTQDEEQIARRLAPKDKWFQTHFKQI